jgi:DNA-binding NtrC family response regulator
MCRQNDHLYTKEKNIVLLEDDRQVLLSYERSLKDKLPLCNLHTFDKIDNKFYNFLNNNKIDLYILDVMVGEEDVRNITSQIIKGNLNSIILFISGFDYNITSFEYLKDLCIYDFMAKPFNMDIFISTIVTLLNVTTTYKKFIKGPSYIDSTRAYYMQQIEKDKKMIEDFEKQFSQVI